MSDYYEEWEASGVRWRNFAGEWTTWEVLRDGHWERRAPTVDDLEAMRPADRELTQWERDFHAGRDLTPVEQLKL